MPRNVHPNDFSHHIGLDIDSVVLLSAHIQAPSGTGAFPLAEALNGSTLHEFLVALTDMVTDDEVVRLHSITANAVRKRTIASSRAFDARIVIRISGSFTGNADVRATMSSSRTANAVVRAILSSSWSSAATIRATASSSFSANAAVTAGAVGTITANADVRATLSGSFTANAVALATQAGSLTADATIVSGSTDFQSDAFQSDAFQ